MTGETVRKLSLLASREPFYLGWYFATYAEMMSVDIADVAGELGCLPEVMNAMSLCRAPRPEPPHFREDIEAVATRFQVRADRLANLVRQVQFVSDQGMLLAARDRDSGDQEDTRTRD